MAELQMQFEKEVYGRIVIEMAIEKGALIGTIRTCLIVLEIDPLEERELTSKSAEELEALAKDLHIKVRTRFGIK